MNKLTKRISLPILSCVVLALNSQSQAQVNVEFSQVGSDVIATWTGSLDAGNWLQDQVYTDQIFAGNQNLFNNDGPTEVYTGGAATSTSLNNTGTLISQSGVSFGFSTFIFFFTGVDDNLAPASSIYNFNYQQQFAGTTLAELGADNFNNTLAWTSSAGGNNTISYSTAGVPEPSSTALIGLGLISLIAHRRR